MAVSSVHGNIAAGLQNSMHWHAKVFIFNPVAWLCLRRPDSDHKHSSCKSFFFSPLPPKFTVFFLFLLSSFLSIFWQNSSTTNRSWVQLQDLYVDLWSHPSWVAPWQDHPCSTSPLPASDQVVFVLSLVVFTHWLLQSVPKTVGNRWHLNPNFHLKTPEKRY